MRLSSVVLPAPFGPMTPRISPGATARSTPSTAASPPKRLRRCLASSSAMASGLPHPLAEQAGRTQQQHQNDQQKAVDVLIRRREERRTERFHDAEQNAGDERARNRAQPADHDDLEAFDGVYHSVRRKHHEHRREQRARNAREGDADAEGDL